MSVIEIIVTPPIHLTLNEEFFTRLLDYCNLSHANKLFVRNFISADKFDDRLKLTFSTQGEDVNPKLTSDLLLVTFEVLKEVEFPRKTVKSKLLTCYELGKANGKRFLKIVERVITK